MKKTHILVAMLILSLAVAAGSLAYNRQISMKNEKYQTFLQNQYQRILYDLANNVDNVEVSLSKALVSNSQKQRGILLGNVWNDSKSAQYKLNALPLNHTAIQNTSKFLSQVSDYSYMILKKNSAGIKPTSNEISTLQKLKDYSGYIRIRFREFVDDFGSKGINLDDMNTDESNSIKMTNVSLGSSISRMSDQIQQYPTLLYDGPFSENVLNIKPQILSQKAVNLKTAAQIAQSITGAKNIADMKLQKSYQEEKIPAYSFVVQRNGEKTPSLNIDITKNGGRILYLLNTRNISKETINANAAIKNGSKFLLKNGFKNMVATYTLKYDGVLVVNYVNKQKGVMLYPDQVKLKIALDDGSIVGMESTQYLTANKERNLPKPKLAIAEASKKVSSELKILHQRIALIPMESLREVLCYEFYGDYHGERYFVYINALNGSEERILKVVNTDNGELTM